MDYSSLGLSHALPIKFHEGCACYAIKYEKFKKYQCFCIVQLLPSTLENYTTAVNIWMRPLLKVMFWKVHRKKVHRP